MERWHVKVVTLVGTFILPFICTVLPYKVSAYITRRGASGKRVLSCLMCFGGGIFFGTYLLHMGPEVQQLMHDSLDELLNPNRTANCLAGIPPRKINYPLPELFAGFGFFIVLFCEKFVLCINKRRLDRKKACHRRSSHSESPHVGEDDTQQTSFLRHSAELSKAQHTCQTGGRKESDMCKECVAGLPCSDPDEDRIHLVKNDRNVVKLRSVDIEDLDVNFAGLNSCRSANACPFSGTGECCADAPTVSKPMMTQEKHIVVALKVDEQKKMEEKLHSHGDGGHHHHATRSIVLILALSLHRIFEGMSIGLQDSTQNVLQLFLAVMCHETVIGFSLGLQFVKMSFPLKRLLFTSFLCSMIMPIGVGIGTAMTEVGQDMKYVNIANGILQAIAMGTFIYVTFFEILQEEIDPEDTSLLKVLFIFFGFAMMALLDLIPEEQQITHLVEDLASALVNTTVEHQSV